MTARFAAADWAVAAAYLAILIGGGCLFSPRTTRDARAYFLADHRVPPWLAAVSVLAASQSAATFLGAPDSSYRGDLSYLSANLGALLGAVVVARVLIPRLYALDAATAYELLGARFGAAATRWAGGAFLAGRILAGGARLYLAAVALAMVATGGGAPAVVIGAAAALVVASLAFTVMGGLRSVLWNDLVQFAIFVGAALAVLIHLRWSIPLATGDLFRALAHAPGGADKLRLIDPSLDPSRPFALPAVLTGVALLTVAAAGMDQDTTQRLLACRDARDGARGLYGSVLAGVPVVAMFLAIGLLLSLRYQRPDLAGVPAAPPPATGVFMHYILTELPPGLRGLATTGIVAAAVATTNSALNAMASVAVADFYRPWCEARGGEGERHYVAAGRIAMVATGAAMLAAAALSLWWQRASDLPLLEFALGVMVFAYAGLLGVYATAVFTRRGTARSVALALAAGFATVLALQPAVAGALRLPGVVTHLAFPWQLCAGAIVAFLVCAAPAGRTVDGGAHRGAF